MRIVGILFVLLLVYDVNAIRAFRSSSRRESDQQDRSEQSNGVVASADVDLVGSLKDLLASHQEKEKHEQSRLEEVIANNNKLQEELMHKRAELANHAQLMTQLEMCLQQTSLVAVGGGTVTNSNNAATTNSNTDTSTVVTAITPSPAGASSNPVDAIAANTVVPNGPTAIVTDSSPSALPAVYGDNNNNNGASTTNNNAGYASSALLDTKHSTNKQNQPVAPPSHRKPIDPEMTMESLMKATPQSLHAKMQELMEREAAISRAEHDFRTKQTLLIQQQDELKQQLKTAQSLKLSASHTLFSPTMVPDGASAFLQDESQQQQQQLPPGLRLPPFPVMKRQTSHHNVPRTREYIAPSYVMAEMKASSSRPTTAAAAPSPSSSSSFLDMSETSWSTASRSLSTSMSSLCTNYNSCATCAADPNCAWCFTAPVSTSDNDTKIASASGSCMSHNVNFIQEGLSEDSYNAAFQQRKRANVMGGVTQVTQLADALILGECKAGEWSSSLANESPTFLSFNVFADDVPATWNGGTPPRVKNLIQLIMSMSPLPHVVAFQEAEGWFVECLRKNATLMAAFAWQTDYGEMIAPGGLFILSRLPLGDINYVEKVSPGQTRIDQRPRMLFASIHFNGRDVWVANTCLDWRDPASRVDSLDFLFTTLSPFRDVVLMGDFNFDEGAPAESSHIPYCDGWIDTWSKLKPGQDGHTWDPSTNVYAYNSDKTSAPSRIDRIFLKSTNLLPMSIGLVGSSDISTHYGLLLQTNLFLSTCPAS